MAQQLLLALTPIENEPRIRDLDLAERLEFSQLPDIRKIIKRNEKKLKEINEIATVARCIETGNGSRRTVQEYYLDQKQAIFICMKSETDKAIDVQMEIVHAFDAYLKGDLVLNTSKTPSTAELRPHLQTPVQIQHSKDVNGLLFSLGGSQKCAEYHSITNYAHTGKTTSQLKQMAKDAGVPSKWRQTGRGAIRQLYPPKAAGISVQDEVYLNRGVPLDTSIEIGRMAAALFEKMALAGASVVEKYLPAPTP